MAIRLFGLRRPKPEHKDPVLLANKGKRPANAEVIRSRLQAQDGLSIVESEGNGGDPYNSTGRLMSEKFRRSLTDD